MAESTFDRRLGHRFTTPGVDVGWRIVSIDGPGGQSHDHSRAVGRLLDLSVTGARIEAPPSAEVDEGSKVVIEIIGQRGSVTVRRISPGSAPHLLLYGVEFTDPQSPLTHLVHDDLLQTFSAKTADHWHLAHYLP